MRVVPGGVRSNLAAHPFDSERHQDTPRAFDLQRTKEPLDDCDATLPTDRTEARSHAVVPAPSLERVTEELTALVGDHMLWLRAGPLHDAVKELADFDGRRRLLE